MVKREFLIINKSSIIKKIIILVLLFFCNSYKGKSQNLPPFAPIGAEWNYSHSTSLGIETKSLTVIDTGTTSQGIKYSKITGPNQFYVSRDSLIVYHSFDTINWYLLYDYNISAGDSFETICCEYLGFIDTFSIKVLVKGDTIIDGFELPYIIMQSNNGNYEFSGLSILNVGNIENYFLPWYALIDPPIRPLRCYSDDLVNLVIESPCDTLIINSVEPSLANYKVNYYPNPVQKDLYISGLPPNINKVQLINNLGQIVMEKHLESRAELVIGMENFSKGMYTIIGISSEGRIISEIIINQ